MKNENFALIVSAYSVLADVECQWPKRHTATGQLLLTGLRDRIAKELCYDPQTIQDAYSTGGLQ